MTNAIPRQSAIWDERRNTSRSFCVPPGALDEARAALAAFRRSAPSLYAWVATGAPRLTADEHVCRFGVSYQAKRTTKR